MAVYFISEGGNGYIKIGKGSGASRAKAMQTGTPWKLTVLKEIYGSYGEENILHKLFFRERLSTGREWFRPSEALIKFINMDDEKIYNTIHNVKVAMSKDKNVKFTLKFEGETNEEVEERRKANLKYEY